MFQNMCKEGKVRGDLHVAAQPAYIQNRNHEWNVLFVHPWSQEHWSSHSSHFPSLFQILLESIPQFYHLVRILSGSESIIVKFIFVILRLVRKKTAIFKVNFTQWHILVLCTFHVYKHCPVPAEQCFLSRYLHVNVKLLHFSYCTRIGKTFLF